MDERLHHQSQTVLNKVNFKDKLSLFMGSLPNEPAQCASTLQELFNTADETDNFLKQVLQLLEKGVKHLTSGMQ